MKTIHSNYNVIGPVFKNIYSVSFETACSIQKARVLKLVQEGLGDYAKEIKVVFVNSFEV